MMGDYHQRTGDRRIHVFMTGIGSMRTHTRFRPTDNEERGDKHERHCKRRRHAHACEHAELKNRHNRGKTKRYKTNEGGKCRQKNWLNYFIHCLHDASAMLLPGGADTRGGAVKIRTNYMNAVCAPDGNKNYRQDGRKDRKWYGTQSHSS